MKDGVSTQLPQSFQTHCRFSRARRHVQLGTTLHASSSSQKLQVASSRIAEPFTHTFTTNFNNQQQPSHELHVAALPRLDWPCTPQKACNQQTGVSSRQPTVNTIELLSNLQQTTAAS
jgi:hypothetical protein